MKKFIPILLSLTLVGCTTGSKTKTNINYYSNVAYTPEPITIYKEVPVEVPVEVVRYKTIYKRVPPRQASVTELGEELGRKILRKMKAAYNET